MVTSDAPVPPSATVISVISVMEPPVIATLSASWEATDPILSPKTKLPNVTPSSKLKPKSIKSGDFLPRPDPPVTVLKF